MTANYEKHGATAFSLIKGHDMATKEIRIAFTLKVNGYGEKVLVCEDDIFKTATGVRNFIDGTRKQIEEFFDIREPESEFDCPECGQPAMNIHVSRKEHWGYCEQCGIKWPTGYGLISWPFDEFTEENRRKALETLSRFRPIESAEAVSF
jgi:predicted RNA-binding Zn-ribbon protein involved in translation (DUF1610 family)